MTTLRADLHVHTCHSKTNGTMPFLRSRDCYSRPQDVYRVAKARGMDLVAITDHDTIDGALDLLDRRPDAPDVIVGEEVSCRLPDGGLEVHLGVYGMTEALHRDVQHLRGNVFDVAARLREAQVFFSLNHLLHFYRPRTPLDVYLRLLGEVPALEVRNGAMLAVHNRLVERMAAGLESGCRPGPLDPAFLAGPKGPALRDGNVRCDGEMRRDDHAQPPRTAAPLALVAGSDAHTLRRVGTTWTEAPGRTREEFLRSVSEGGGVPGGCDGTVFTVAGDTYGVIVRYVASLAGMGPRDHGAAHRAACLAFTAASLPFQFLPLAIALKGKWRERRTVREVGGRLRGASPRTQRFAADRAEPAGNS